MLRAATSAFDRIDALWEGTPMRKAVAAALAVAYVGALLAVEASQRGWLPSLVRIRPTHGHFVAVELALYLLLSYEVVGLVLGIAQSVSKAAGKQFEIFSLILLRHSFEEFGNLGEPILWAQAQGPVLRMLSNAFGALVIFVVLGFYYGARGRRPAGDPHARQGFIDAKKVVALFLLVLFAGLAVRAAFTERGAFFEHFYTVLVLADVLFVFLSLRYSSAYHIVFRNSGLAVATVVLRVALSAPPYYNAALGIASAVFALALTLAQNRLAPVLERKKGGGGAQEAGAGAPPHGFA